MLACQAFRSLQDFEVDTRCLGARVMPSAIPAKTESSACPRRILCHRFGHPVPAPGSKCPPRGLQLASCCLLLAREKQAARSEPQVASCELREASSKKRGASNKKQVTGATRARPSACRRPSVRCPTLRGARRP